ESAPALRSIDRKAPTLTACDGRDGDGRRVPLSKDNIGGTDALAGGRPGRAADDVIEAVAIDVPQHRDRSSKIAALARAGDDESTLTAFDRRQRNRPGLAGAEDH